MRRTSNVTSQNRHLYVRSPAICAITNSACILQTVPLICVFMQLDTGQCRTNINIGLSIDATSGVNHKMDI